MRRILFLIGITALIVATTTADLQAARHRGRLRVPRTTSSGAVRSVVKPTAYPRVRQIDGRTLWDLGMQKGQWPVLP